MRLRIKNKLWLVILGMALTSIVPQEEAYAYNFVSPPDVKNACPSLPGFTQRIVGCIKETVVYSANVLLSDFFGYMYGALVACITLAVAFWGVQMATARPRFATRAGFVLAMKVAALVMLFTGATFNFGWFFGAALDIAEWLLAAVTGYVDYSPSFGAACAAQGGIVPNDSSIVWYRVDCALESLIGGVMPISTVASGIAGFLVAALVSGGAGIFIGLLGFFLVIQMMVVIARAVYVFITAYLAISVMAIVAPLFLPLILFNVTKGYFEKWARLTLGFVLQPLFLFVYLMMLLAAYDTVVYTGPLALYRALAGDAAYCNGAANCNFRIGEWLFDSGAYAEAPTGGYAINTDSGKSASKGLGDLQTGVADKLPEAKTDQADWDKSLWEQAGDTNIYEYLGLDQFFFHIDIPKEVVDWKHLAAIDDAACFASNPVDQHHSKCVAPYIQFLFLSIIMAAIVAYVFWLMLRMLPFIGVGVVGDVLATPTLGAMSAPGEGMLGSIRKVLMKGA